MYSSGHQITLSSNFIARTGAEKSREKLTFRRIGGGSNFPEFWVQRWYAVGILGVSRPLVGTDYPSGKQEDVDAAH